jgi:hypothetical protein
VIGNARSLSLDCGLGLVLLIGRSGCFHSLGVMIDSGLEMSAERNLVMRDDHVAMLWYLAGKHAVMSWRDLLICFLSLLTYIPTTRKCHVVHGLSISYHGYVIIRSELKVLSPARDFLPLAISTSNLHRIISRLLFVCNMHVDNHEIHGCIQCLVCLQCHDSLGGGAGS